MKMRNSEFGMGNDASQKAKEDTYLHERKHILRNDLFSPLPAVECERNI